MKSMLMAIPTLRDGEPLLREDFMDRWEALPDLKFAELIGGMVRLRLYPLSLDHGEGDSNANFWLRHYATATPGCAVSSDSTWYMRDDAPQPECSLRILPECGGQSSTFIRNGKRFGIGAPELVVEVSLATRSYDLSVKKELYRQTGVLEFICIQPEKKKVVWFHLTGPNYAEVKAKAGVFRSQVFPGLWLDAKALLTDNSARVLAVLREGLETPEYVKFQADLAARKKKSTTGK